MCGQRLITWWLTRCKSAELALRLQVVGDTGERLEHPYSGHRENGNVAICEIGNLVR